MKGRKDIRKAIERSRAMYGSYNPDEWVGMGFYEATGGYVVVHRRRLENSRKSGNEARKFAVEFEMSEVFARKGYRIEMLDEDPRRRSYDVNINGVPADLKYVRSLNGIVRNAKEAINKQKALLVLFKFDTVTPATIGRIKMLISMNIHGKYIVGNMGRVYEF